MPLPASVNLVTVNIQIAHLADGTPANGSVTFIAPFLLRTSDGYLLGNEPNIIATLSNGAATVQLPATDSPGVSPSGWAWTALVSTDARQDRFSFLLPSTPNVVNFKDLVPIIAPPTPQIFAVDSTVMHLAGPETATGTKSFTGGLSSLDIAVTGITGAANASRWVGATISGAPTTGTFAVGDTAIDQAGTMWVCVVAGTPGTWQAPTSQLVYNVLHYGARGDGVTDDQAALNALAASISAAGGGVMFTPQRITCNVSQSVAPYTNVKVLGSGRTSVWRATTSVPAIANATGAGGSISDYTVEDMTFTGPVTSEPSMPTRARTTSGAGTTTAISLDGSLDPNVSNAPVITNVIVRNVRVLNCTSLPIRLFGITGRCEVSGCEFRNNMDAGWGFCQEVILDRCRSINSADNGFSVSRGNTKITMTNCTVENAAYYGIWLSGFGGNVGPTDFSVTGNTVKGCGQSGIVLMDAPGYGVVAGNMIDKMYYRGEVSAPDDTTCCGIYVRGDSTSLGSPTKFSKGILITANTIKASAKAGIYLTAAQAIAVKHNLILDPGTQYWADGVTLIPSNFGSQNVGVYVDQPGTCTNLEITNNATIDTRATPYGNYGVMPIPCANVTTSANSMYGLRNTSNLPTVPRGDTIGRRSAAAETITRIQANNSSSITMSSGAVRFAYVIPEQTMVCGHISISSGSTAAGATPTLVRFGIYSVDSSGNLTQIAQTNSATGTFAAALTAYSVALTSSVTLNQGQQYAIAAIVVTATTAPTVMGALCGTGQDNLQTPTLSAVVTAQSDLSASYTVGQLVGSQSLVYAAALP